MDISRRKGSKHRILSQEQIQIVHESTLELLERTGVQVQCTEALEVLKQSGCDVSNPRQVKIPRKLVAKAIEAAPKSIQVYDRDGNPALALQEDTCYYGTGSDCTHHIDLFSGKRRTTTKEDVGNLARFCDALPNIDFVMSMGIAYDTPRGTSFVHQYEAMLQHLVRIGRGLEAGVLDSGPRNDQRGYYSGPGVAEAGIHPGGPNAPPVRGQ